MFPQHKNPNSGQPDGLDLQRCHRVLAFLTVQAEVLSVATEVEVAHRRAQMVHHAPHVLVGEDAPGDVELH